VVDQAVDHGCGHDVIGEGLAPANGKFEVTMIEPISYLEAINWKNRFAASWSNGM
jgi:hypothetical protein